MHKNKFINRSLYAVLIAGASTTLFSCSDDMHENITGNETDIVSFSIDNYSWGNAADTRSGEAVGHEIDRAVLRAEGSRDTLCVRAIETDGIDLGSASPATRGTQIVGETAVETFGCLGYTNQGGSNKFYIPNEKYYKAQNGGFTSDNIYYWPGQQLTLDFYCYSPYGANGLTVPKNAPEARELSYVVPDNVAEQQDLMLAAGGDLHGVVGNKNTVLPLHFNHLLSAVKIVTGPNMMAGTIKKITFKNLYGSANLDMDAPQAWKDHADYKTFTYEPNVTVAAGADHDVMAGENTMLMLPQAMKPADSLEPTMLEIVFNEGDGKADRTLETELTGEWLMGKTYTYRLSITPEYELEFTPDNPAAADAHYSIVPIKIKANELKSGWTITSDQTWATLKSKLTPFEQQGYWLENTGDYSKYCDNQKVPVERGTTLAGTEGGNAVILYLFLEENAGTTDRTVTLSVKPTGQDNVTPSTITITQHHPIWDSNGAGWEAIEEPENANLPYGFLWDRHVVLKSANTMGGVEAWIYKMMLRTGGGLDIIWDATYPAFVKKFTVPHVWETNYMRIELDYSAVNNVSGALDSNNGLTNTYNLYTASGGNALTSEQMLRDSYGFTVETTYKEGESVADYAAAICIRKNKFTVSEQTQSERTMYELNQLTQNDIKWYLPAINQFGTDAPMINSNAPYWSSTAVHNGSDNSNAKSWTNGLPSDKVRTAKFNVRAARVPQNQ